MTTTQIHTAPTKSSPSPRRPRNSRAAVAVLAVAVVTILTVVVLAPWDREAEPSAPPGPAPSAVPRAYHPGGSVYEQQVPRAG